MPTIRYHSSGFMDCAQNDQSCDSLGSVNDGTLQSWLPLSDRGFSLATSALSAEISNIAAAIKPTCEIGQTKRSYPSSHSGELDALQSTRPLAEQAFSRAAGAPLLGGNTVRLLIDAAQNYPAWLAAIGSARSHIYFESYIIHEDSSGLEFAQALIAKAKEGVRVRLVYDWMGGFGKTSRRFWGRLRDGGVEVRCYNAPRFDSPLGWLSRDHRKMLAVDGEVGFISGLCVGRMWVGEPAKNIAPWRDTGIEVHGPAVADIERAFADVWALMGEPIPDDEPTGMRVLSPAGNVALRVVATVPATAELFRLDQLVAAIARKNLWLTDAYYAGTTSYVQALRAAARDGVDVRLLVPNGTDIPLLRPLSRSGYRPLLEAGVRIFEWNGTMIHAKTAVADGRWARVGSTNLNIASWLGNCELDAVIENDEFARQMEEQYLTDLSNATEVILNARSRVSAPGEPRHRVPFATSGGGSSGRAAAGAIRISNAVGAAFSDRRVLRPIEAQLVLVAGLLLLGIAALLYFVPQVAGYVLMAIFGWIGIALVYRAWKLYRKRNSGIDSR
jgi:cardiolipin synthase